MLHLLHYVWRKVLSVIKKICDQIFTLLQSDLIRLSPPPPTQTKLSLQKLLTFPKMISFPPPPPPPQKI